MRKEKLLWNLHPKFRNTIANYVYQAIVMVVNCIRNRYQQKDYIETLQTMSKLREDNFGH